MGSGVLWGWPQELLAVFVIRDSLRNLCAVVKFDSWQNLDLRLAAA